VMSKAEIVAELEKLTPEERQEIRIRLAELDNEEWLDDGALTDQQKALIEERIRNYDSQKSISWGEAKEQLMTPFRK